MPATDCPAALLSQERQRDEAREKEKRELEEVKEVCKERYGERKCILEDKTGTVKARQTEAQPEGNVFSKSSKQFKTERKRGRQREKERESERKGERELP